jgi:hypothetical protein
MLTVLTPANSTSLTTFANFQARFSDVTSAQSALVGALINEASSRIATYCQRAAGAQAFGKRQLQQTIRPAYTSYNLYDPLVPGVLYREPNPLVLDDLGPIITIDSLQVRDAGSGNMITLVQDTDYELDGLRVFRLSNDMRVFWTYRKIVISFTTGYVLPGDTGTPSLPGAIESACIDLVRLGLKAVNRDPNVSKETLFGVAQVDYIVPGSNNAPAMKGGLPADIAERLNPYVFRAVE